jgi:hypothetical protein
MARLRNTSTISSNLKVRRAAPVLAAVFVLAGCSVIGGGDAGSLYEIAKNVWSGSSKKVTLEEAASVPYASMGIRLGGSPEVMIILAGDMGGQRLWTSAAKIAITTKDGRIVRTAGFEHNLGGYGPQGDTLGKDGGRTLRWQADFPDLSLYSVPIVCRDRPAGDETIVILGKDVHTRRIDESCANEGSELDWSFDNTYWLDPASGLVWRSIQHVHPRLDAIETEILRPPVEH